MTAVEFANVSLAFTREAVLTQLSLRLEAHQTHAILGPSGSGKSTALRCLMGLVKPNAGTVSIFGQPVAPATSPSQRQANRAIGLVPQDGGLFPHLDAHRNATLPAVLANWPTDRIERRQRELEALVGLEPTLRSRRIRELSGGQRQRVALCRALMLDPPLLLLDEPFSALDPESRTELQAEMERIVRQVGKTVVLVTHDVAEAFRLADTIALLERGRLVQHGAASDVVRQPASDWARAFLQAATPPWRGLLAAIDSGREA